MFTALLPRTNSVAPRMGDFWSLFDEGFDSALSPWYDKSAAFNPSVDVVENDKTYDLSVDLPGFDKKDIAVDVKDGVLSISGNRKVERKKVDKHYSYYERNTGEFRRSFKLPDTVNQNSVKASYKDGVLQLSIDKSEEAKPRAIEVK